MRFSTRLVTNLSLLTAISIVLTRVFGIVLPLGGALALRLGFGEIPIMLAGVLFGPIPGAVTGAAADLVGFLINPHGGPYFPGFTITAALTGLIAGIMAKRMRRYNWREMGLMVLVNDLISNVTLNTIWLVIMYELDVRVILPARLLARLVTIPIYTVVLVLIARIHGKLDK